MVPKSPGPYSWFAIKSSKFKLTTLSIKCLLNVSNSVLKGLCKLQVDIPINTRVMAVQSLGDLHAFICGSHVGR